MQEYKQISFHNSVVYNPLFVSEHSVEIVNINFLDLDSNTVIHWICMQGRSQSQTLNPGWARATFPQFFLILIDFLYLSSIFLHFLPQFEAPGGWTREGPGYATVCMHTCFTCEVVVDGATWCSSQDSMAMWSTIFKLSKFDTNLHLGSSLPGRVSGPIIQSINQ